MRIRMLRDWQGRTAGSVLEPLSQGAAEILVQRGFAEEVQPPPQLVTQELPPLPSANRGNRKRR